MENKYKNRDLSWCDFNERILQEVICDIPIMEKVKMFSNIEELKTNKTKEKAK